MNERNDHPSMERLNAFVEGSLDGDVRTGVESHLAGCEACRSEADELRTVFRELSGLTTFSPAAGFAERVMSNVRVRRPAFAGAGRWLEGMVPQSTGSWAAAAALLALPVVGAAILVSWVMSQPGVTPQGLWTLASGLAVDGLSNGMQWAWGRLAGTPIVGRLSEGLEIVAAAGTGELGLAAVLFATLTAGSIYVLYQNLFRPMAGRTEHASYVF